MSRMHTALLAHCREKATEALRNAEISETSGEHEYWIALQAKWNDLADFYCPEEPANIPGVFKV